MLDARLGHVERDRADRPSNLLIVWRSIFDLNDTRLRGVPAAGWRDIAHLSSKNARDPRALCGDSDVRTDHALRRCTGSHDRIVTGIRGRREARGLLIDSGEISTAASSSGYGPVIVAVADHVRRAILVARFAARSSQVLHMNHPVRALSW